MSTSPNAHGGRGDQTATARSNSRSRMRHGAGERMSKQRIQTRPSDVQQLKDLRPVLLAWLRSKDAFFSPLEAATGLDREQMFYAVSAIVLLYLILGNFAGLLCNMIGFVYPAFQSCTGRRSPSSLCPTSSPHRSTATSRSTGPLKPCSFSTWHCRRPMERTIFPVDVELQAGLLRGFESIFLHKRVRSFLGVPFAEPPIGELRFLPPRLKKPWNETIEATTLASACYQGRDTYNESFWGSEMWNANTPVSEDCLYMNIWAPAEASNLTVLVWFFGGGFWYGSPSLLLYDGKALALTANAIVVNINYRLGAFGYLYLGDSEVPGNMGMLDQQLALYWIRENIGAFGGNPKSVTIFGESAGASSIVAHLIAPGSRGLFHNGILQSGSLDNRWSMDTPKRALEKSRDLAKLVGCNRTNIHDMARCLRRVPPAENIYNLPKFFDHQTQPLMGINEFNECVNTAFARLPEVIRAAAAYVYTGNNRCDYANGQHRFLADQVNQMVGDYFFTCDSLWFADQFDDSPGHVYIYYFDEPSSANPWPKWTGVMHGYEIEFVFGIPLYNTSAGYSNRERTLSKKMIQLWTSFATTGVPSLSDHREDRLHWPQYHSQNAPRWMHLKASHLKQNKITEKCEQKRFDYCHNQKNKIICSPGNIGHSRWHGILVKTEHNDGNVVVNILLSITSKIMKYEHYYGAVNMFWPNKWWETEKQFNESIEGELLINGDFIPISVISVGQIDISNRFATLKTPYEEKLTEVSYKNFTFRGLIHKNKTNNKVQIAFLHGTSKSSMLELKRIFGALFLTINYSEANTIMESNKVNGGVELFINPSIGLPDIAKETYRLDHLYETGTILCFEAYIKSSKEIVDCTKENHFTVNLFHDANEFTEKIGDTVLKLNFVFNLNQYKTNKCKESAAHLEMSSYSHKDKWYERVYLPNPIVQSGVNFTLRIDLDDDYFKIFINEAIHPILYQHRLPGWATEWIENGEWHKSSCDKKQNSLRQNNGVCTHKHDLKLVKGEYFNLNIVVREKEYRWRYKVGGEFYNYKHVIPAEAVQYINVEGLEKHPDYDNIIKLDKLY
uniref:Acetylcholinesterase n=1 Tax=Meloidogyne javanica TaxID=6303 RepID=A0A915M9Q2_MELJA